MRRTSFDVSLAHYWVGRILEELNARVLFIKPLGKLILQISTVNNAKKIGENVNKKY